MTTYRAPRQTLRERGCEASMVSQPLLQREPQHTIKGLKGYRGKNQGLSEELSAAQKAGRKYPS